MKPVLALIIAATLLGAQPPARDAPVFTTIKAGKFAFSYRVDGPNLVARLSYPTKGWVAVGFNPKTKMKNANLIIGYANGGGGVVEDHFGTDVVEHTNDTLIGGKNDLTASSCLRTGDTTVLSFTIPLDSGDPRDSKLERGREIKLFFAAGATTEYRKHTALAKAKITL